MKQKDIIWIGFPFSDFSKRKIRPALVISNNEYNAKSEDIIICAITSNLKEAQYSVSINESSISSGSLQIQSMVKADKIMQVNKKLALKAFAKLKDKKFEEVTKQIKKLIST